MTRRLKGETIVIVLTDRSVADATTPQTAATGAGRLAHLSGGRTDPAAPRTPTRPHQARQPAPVAAVPFPPLDVTAPLIPWTPAECADARARWAAAGEAY